MRYIKPELFREAFDVEDIITASGSIPPGGGDPDPDPELPPIDPDPYEMPLMPIG